MFDASYLFCTRNRDECIQSLHKAQKRSLEECSVLFDNTHKRISDQMMVVSYEEQRNNHEKLMLKVTEKCDIEYRKTLFLVEPKLYRNQK